MPQKNTYSLVSRKNLKTTSYDSPEVFSITAKKIATNSLFVVYSPEPGFTPSLPSPFKGEGLGGGEPKHPAIPGVIFIFPFLPMNNNTKSRTLIVFDMDGVLIDVSGSYRDTVRQTARLFFKGALSWESLPDPLFSLTDLARLKQSGGLNNDWDLTFLVINLLFTRVKASTDYQDPDPWSRYSKMIKSCDVAALSRFLKSVKRPITTLMEEKGRITDTFIAGLYTGDVGSGNIIKQIFQEIYLGEELFESTYGIQNKIFYKKGYIKREKLLIDTAVLEALSKRNILAIATGRPRLEADYPLDFFGLRKFFSVIFTHDDCLGEEKKIFDQKQKKVALGKPNPYMLDAVKETQNNNVSRCYYIGDMPDDMIAASRSRSGFIGIGILISSSDKEHLKKDLLQAGADYVVEDFDELVKIIESNG